MYNERMKVLFDIFDEDRDGIIDFKEFVRGIYKITENVHGASKASMEAMLICDDTHSRSLNFEAFKKVILKMHHAAPDDMSLDDVLDAMTQSILRPGDVSMVDLPKLFSIDDTLSGSNKIEYGSILMRNDENSVLGALEYAKIFRLFELWDLDNDGSISFGELLLGLRKFEETTDITKTVDECCAVMNAFNEGDNQELDFSEFVTFIQHFIEVSGADIHDMLDFMIVTAALKENTKDEQAFLNLIELKYEE